MILSFQNYDGKEYKWNIRRLGNKVQIVILFTQHNIYVSINDLNMSSRLWVHRKDSTESFGLNNSEKALLYAQKLYNTTGYG